MVNDMQKNPEILAPAGSIETLYAALDMGADAVYVGAQRFGARAFAKNPTIEELVSAITYAHLRGKRIYLTTNTLLMDSELDELVTMIKPLVDAGLDAAIVQDPGVLIKLHEAYPTLDLHASTQMAIFSGEEAELLRPYGVTRFVPARELSIEEIRQARAQTDLEIEVFVHGALCVCYSGWCLMSEYIGGRSGNRGMCAGPCRLPYTRPDSGRTSFELNSKDSETLLHIPELIEAGIDSFKIEGRMKSMEYASYLAYLYRRYSDIYLDEGYDYYRDLVENTESVLHKERRNAMELYNRGGFFPSYLFAKDDEVTIEPQIKGHYGLKVGHVTAVNRTRQIKESSCEILIEKQLYPHDVLAIRNSSGETVYEFTVGAGAMSGSIADVSIGFSSVSEGDEIFRTKNATLLSMIGGMIGESGLKSMLPIRGRWIGKIGQAAALEISADIFVPAKHMPGEPHEVMDLEKRTVSVSATGMMVEPASNAPVTSLDVRERLSSLGGTGYTWDALVVDMEEGAFIPLKAIKELRRLAIAELEKEALKIWRAISETRYHDERASMTEVGSMHEKQAEDRKPEDNTYVSDVDTDGATWISVSNMSQLECVVEILKDVSRKGKYVLHVKLGGFSGVQLDEIHTMWMVFRKYKSDIVWAFSLPRAFRGREKEEKMSELAAFFEKCFTKDAAVRKAEEESIEKVDNSGHRVLFVANSLASIVFRNKYAKSFPMIAYENMYMENSLAKRFYGELGVGSTMPKRSYGRIPVMISAHRIAEGEIRTPKGDEFIVVKPEGVSYRVIYTKDRITSEKDTDKNEGSGVWVDFSIENEEEVKEVLGKWL